MAMSYSWKQKNNTKSSTEAELVGVDDLLAYILWARYFLEEQGYKMQPSLLYQDNISAILLETNGKASSSKHMKHIKVRYFYIKDKIDQGEIMVEHCPTDQMWTDINTKPKQGAAFRNFRAQVMGIEPDYCDAYYSTRIHVRPPETSQASYPEEHQPAYQRQSMLPVPTLDRGAPQECVGGETYERNTDAADVATGDNVASSEQQKAPLRWVQGRRWSPGVYALMRQLGKPLRIAWERAFVDRLTS
jgi:hypothetical protein